MRCELCGKDIGNTIVLLPIKKNDGALSMMACLNCAESSWAYCKKHSRPHLGFIDDTTACILCVEELMAEKGKGEVDIFQKILEVIPPEEKKGLLNWATTVSCIKQESEATSILRAVATSALRHKKTIEQVVAQVRKEKSVTSILPEWLF